MTQEELDKFLAEQERKAGVGTGGEGTTSAGATGLEHFTNRMLFGNAGLIAAAASNPEYGGNPALQVSREDVKAKLARGAEEHPTAAAVGNTAADVIQQAALAATPVGAAVRGGRLASGIANQALVGGLQEAAQSGSSVLQGDKTIEEAAKDVAAQAALGGAGGAVGHAVTRVLDPVASKIGTLLGPEEAALIKSTYAPGATVAEQAGVRATPGQAAEIGGMLARNPATEASIAAGRNLEQQMANVGARQNPAAFGVRQEAQREGLDASRALLTRELEAAKTAAAPGEATSLTGLSRIGPATEEARKAIVPTLEEGVGKNSPLAYRKAGDVMEQRMASTLDPAARQQLATDLLKTRSAIAQKAPPEGLLANLEGMKAVRQPLEDVVERGLPKAAKEPARRGGVTLGDVLMTGAGGGLGALTHGTLGGIVGATLPYATKGAVAAGKAVAKAGEGGALAQYLADPAAFVAQLGKASKGRGPASVVASQLLGPIAGMLAANPALRGFLPGG